MTIEITIGMKLHQRSYGEDIFLGIHKQIMFPMQIFLDMAVLIDAQGDMLDNIESQVIELF